MKFLDGTSPGKKIKNQTKQFLVPDNKDNNDKIENESGPALGSPDLIGNPIYPTVRPGIPTKKPTIQTTFPTTLNRKPGQFTFSVPCHGVSH